MTAMLSTVFTLTLLASTTDEPVVPLAGFATLIGSSVDTANAKHARWDATRFVIRMAPAGAVRAGGRTNLAFAGPPLILEAPGCLARYCEPLLTFIPGGAMALGTRFALNEWLGLTPEVNAFALHHSFGETRNMVAGIVGGLGTDVMFGEGTERFYLGAGLAGGRLHVRGRDGYGLTPFLDLGIRAAVSARHMVSASIRGTWIQPFGGAGLPAVTLELGFEIGS